MADLYNKLGIKDFDQMTADTLQSIVDSGVGITNTTPGSVVRTIVEAILDNVDAMNYYINFVYNALGIDEATGEDLDRLISILGVTRKQPTYATGVVTFSTGDAPYAYDIVIPYGYEVSTRQTNDGTVYTYLVNEENIVLPAGQISIDVNVRASIPGHQYLPAGSLSVMGKSIVGIASVVNQDAVNSGDDVETDDELRNRTKEIVSAFGKCTDNALKMAVEEVDGVINCEVVDQYNGIGTTGVIVVPEILPIVDSVAEQINKVVAETKASGIRAYIIFPTIKYISINIEITETVDDALVIESIFEYVNSLRVGQTFVIKQMERKILNAIDENHIQNDDIDINTITPSGNVTCATEEIIRVNTITVNGVVHDV